MNESREYCSAGDHHEMEWASVSAVAHRELAKRAQARGAHSSIAKPSDGHGMWGDFSHYPLFSALAAGARLPDDPIWPQFAALILWPSLGPAVLRLTPVEPVSQAAALTLATWLRQAVERPQLLSDMRTLIGEDPTPSELAGINPNFKQARQRVIWQAIRTHLEHYLVSQPTTALAHDKGDSDDRQTAGADYGSVLKEIDPSFLEDSQNEGLAPEDAGAVSYKSVEGNIEDPLTNIITRHKSRVIGSARDFNHLPLHWDHLTSHERAVLRHELAVRYTIDDQRVGTIGLSLSALTALRPGAVARLPVYATVERALEALAQNGSSLAWLAEQLLFLQTVPARECSYQRPADARLQAPHCNYNALLLPSLLCSELVDRGARTVSHLFACLPDLALQTRRVAADIRERGAPRLQLGRIQKSVADVIYEHSGDECLAAVTLPGAAVPVGAGIYYSSQPAERVLEAHRRAAFEVVPWPIAASSDAIRKLLSGNHIGSQLIILPSDAAQAVRSLGERAKSASRLGRRTLEAVVDALNLQTAYTIAVLLLTTVHRPTVDPFPLPTDIDVATGNALICDKRGKQPSWQRIVPVSAVVAQQVAAHRVSVASVARYFDVMEPLVAAQLKSLADSDAGFPSTAAYPLLEIRDGRVTLQPFAPSDIKRLWPEWVWPLNGNRHLLMQFLCGRGVRRETLNYMFGHAELGQVPFGSDSSITPLQFSANVLPHLEAAALAFGINVLPSLRAYEVRVAVTQPAFAAAPSFGDHSASRNERHLTRAQRDTCMRIRSQPNIWNEPDAVIRLDLLNAEVDSAFAGKRAVTRAASGWLRRWNGKHHCQAPLRFSRGDSRRFLLESSDLGRHELQDRDVGRTARDVVIKSALRLLDASLPNEGDPAEWLAQIYLLAVMLGGAHQRGFDRILVEHFGEQSYWDGRHAWLEWNERGRLHRWVYDPLSALVFARFRATFPKSLPSISIEDLHSRARKSLSGMPGIATSGRRTWSILRDRFAEVARSVHREFVPGLIMAHLTGSRVSAPVPRTTLARAGGSRLSTQAQCSEAVTCSGNRGHELPHSNTTDKVLCLIKSAVAESLGSSAKGGEARGIRSARLNKLRVELKSLEAVLVEVPVVYQMVLLRLRKLVESGGRLKAVLATSTISQYMAPVFRFAASPVGRHMLTAEQHEIEGCYFRLVRAGSKSKAGQRLANLEDFHQLAVTHWGAVEIDWDEVVGDLPIYASRIDADMVHEHEIDLADELIEAAVDFPSDIRLMARLTLYLMVDGAARFGEAFRLRVGDVPAPTAYLLIRNSTYGEVKTPSSIRVIPLEGVLRDKGRDLLNAARARALEIGAGDPGTPLMCDARDGRWMALRSEIHALLSDALRTASGSANIRPHHLRHTAISQISASAESALGDSASSGSLRKSLVGESGPTRRSAHALSQLAGHAGTDVTRRVYVHQMEFRASQIFSQHLAPLAVSQIALLTGVGEATTRKRKSRGMSTLAQLHSATAEAFTRVMDIEAWRGIELTLSTSPSALQVLPSSERLPLGSIHRMLDAQQTRGISPAGISACWSVPQHFANRLAEASAQTTIDHHYQPFHNCGPPPPWAGYEFRSRQERKRTPPFLFSSLSILRMDELPASQENTCDASIALRSFDTFSCAWTVRTAPELLSVLRWLTTSGIRDEEIEIEAPTSEACVVPAPLRALTVALGSFHFIPTPMRQLRKRGGESVTIRAKPGGNTGAATSLNHATYLWLVRAGAVS